jgi:hypothetical protein
MGAPDLRTLRKTHSAVVPPTVTRGAGRGLYSPQRDRLAGFEDIRIPVAYVRNRRSPVSLRLPTFVNADWVQKEGRVCKRPGLCSLTSNVEL